MSKLITPDELHRTAKYFMDNGRAASDVEAITLLRSFGLSVVVGPEVATSRAHQIALLTLVNAAKRTFLGGIEVVGLSEGTLLVPLAKGSDLRSAVRSCGGRIVRRTRPGWPVALIGETFHSPKTASWRLTWEGWRGGVVPPNQGMRLADDNAVPLAPAVAAAVCIAEAFAFHAKDHAMAGKRAAGVSLWRPGADWHSKASDGPAITYLPTRLWLIGLGNLGQAYLWLLACLPFADASAVELVLQDFDRLALSNESTSVLSSSRIVGQMKTRAMAQWVEARGFRAAIEERRFGPWMRRAPDEPGVGLCGVDNALARTALEEVGFDLIVEAGLGAGPDAFRSFSVHSFPASRHADAIWSKQVGHSDGDVSSMPAYKTLTKLGMDECGLAQLASRTVGVPFVGITAGALLFAELLRRLHGGSAFEIVAGSLLSLEDIDAGGEHQATYLFGHQAIA